MNFFSWVFEVHETSLVWNYKYAGTRHTHMCHFFFFLVKIFWLFCVCCFAHLLINLCKNVTTSLDVESGRLQASDMLQHLWTGPISSDSVDVVQGAWSVEVQAVGVTKVHAFWFAGSLFITVLWFINVTCYSISQKRHEVTYWLCPLYYKVVIN